MLDEKAQQWWKRAVVYQIYPRSFADSNGDGIGDIPGIINKLDYLKDLGIDVIWLSPVYQSPNDDNGYDISDYQAILPEFGSMEDWDALLAQMHTRGIRLVMDLVVNHSSDEHEWFRRSRAGEGKYRDYYIWDKGRDGGPPNNWASVFGGSAWEYDPQRDEYYLHLFSKKQPDLNWDSPELRQDVYAMMRWWLDRGIDGFRMDVINFISKAPGLPDAAGEGLGPHWGGAHFVHGPNLNAYLAEMKREVLDHYDVMTVGEAPLATPEHAVGLTDEREGVVNMLFQFEHMDFEVAKHGGPKWSLQPWELGDFKAVMTRWQTALASKGWNSLYLSNHDQPRAVSRFGDDGIYRVESAKMLAIFLHMLRGTPYVYQGEEIGMTNVAFPSIEDYRDIETLNMYREYVTEKGEAPSRVLAALHAKSRDNARTPMQWNPGPQAGFTTGRPWIGVNQNFARVNVAAAQADPQSIYHCYKQLIRLRHENAVMVHGTYEPILEEHAQVFAFVRSLAPERWLVLCNFNAAAAQLELPADLMFAKSELVIGNYGGDTPKVAQLLTLRPYEARVYSLS